MFLSINYVLTLNFCPATQLTVILARFGTSLKTLGPPFKILDSQDSWIQEAFFAHVLKKILGSLLNPLLAPASSKWGAEIETHFALYRLKNTVVAYE